MSAPRFQDLPDPVARALRGYYRLRRLYAFLRVLAAAAALYLGLAFVAMHVDRLLFLTPGARWVLWGLAHGLPAACAAAAVARLLLRPPSARQIAYELEARLPGAANEWLVTAEGLRGEAPDAAGPVRADLLDQLRQAAERASAGLSAPRLVRDRGLHRAGGALAAGVALFGLLALVPGYQFPLMAHRFLRPGANLPKPSFVRIAVTPERLVLGRGDEAVLQAEVRGEIPAALAWLYRLAGATPNRCLIATAPGEAADVRVQPASARELNRVQRRLFVYAQADLQESFSYRLRCGDAQTEVRLVEVVAQPRITRLTVRVQPPAYTRLPPQEFSSPRQPVRVFAGSRVELSFAVDQPVPVRRLTAGGKDVPLTKWDESAREGRYAFTMDDKVDLEVRVANARGFANVDRARISLAPLEDQTPAVQLEYPAADLTVVPGELIPLQAVAEDDLEITEAALRFQMNPESNPDQAFQELPLACDGLHSNRLTLTDSFDLGRTAAGPGDELLLLVRVRDSAGNDGESRPVRIRVTAFARGENERRRLAALRVLLEALAAFAEKPPARAQPALNRDLYDHALQRAAAAGVALDAEPSFDSLLRLLELEQHFTDAPRHKDDVRAFSGALFAGWARGEFARVPGAELLEPIVRSRELQNVTWRLFGMQYELDDIQRRLAGLEADEARGRADADAALRGFIEAVATDAAGHKEVGAAYRREFELRKQASEIQDGATAGEAVANPFAPLQLDVDAAKLKPEDEQRLAAVRAELAKATAERKRLVEAAIRESTERWAAAHRNQALPLEPADTRVLVATVFDRVARPPAEGLPAVTPDARRELAEELAAARLTARATGESPARQSVRRRADLYLKALEQIGIDLAALAGRPPLQAAELKALQGELNTAAYYLNHGGPARNLASCDEVAQLLRRLLALVQPALPAFLREEVQARAALQTAYDTAWRQAAEGFAASASDAPRWDLAARWAEADLQMLERNPFGGFWPRVADLALLQALERRRQGEPAPLSPALLAPSSELKQAAETERREWSRAAVRWELGELNASDRITPAEKALAASLLSDDRGPDAAALTRAETVLKAAAREALGAADGPAAAREALARVEAAAQALTALDAAVGGGEAAAVTQAVEQATAALLAAQRGCDELVHRAALWTSSLDPLAPAAAQQERFLLQLREAAARYRGRTSDASRALGQSRGRELDTTQLAALGADLTILRAGVQGLQTSLQSALETYAAPASGPQYPILATFAETRAWLAIAAELAGPGRPADVAGRFVKDHAAARLEFLGSRLALLGAAAAELRAAEARLDATPADAAGAAQSTAAAGRSLASFLQALEQAGRGELQDGIRRECEPLAARAARLAAEPAGGGDTEARRRLLAVAELARDTERVVRRVRAEVDAATAVPLEYAGGPEGIWLPATRLDAEAARQRLLGQVRQARRAFVLAVLEGLEPKPDAARMGEAAVWAAFGHRVARSPLSGAVTPPRTEAASAAARNPLVKWLLEQLDEAAGKTRSEDSLRHYPAVTRELLRSLKDYLRY